MLREVITTTSLQQHPSHEEFHQWWAEWYGSDVYPTYGCGVGWVLWTASQVMKKKTTGSVKSTINWRYAVKVRKPSWQLLKRLLSSLPQAQDWILRMADLQQRVNLAALRSLCQNQSPEREWVRPCNMEWEHCGGWAREFEPPRSWSLWTLQVGRSGSLIPKLEEKSPSSPGDPSKPSPEAVAWWMSVLLWICSCLPSLPQDPANM